MDNLKTSNEQYEKLKQSEEMLLALMKATSDVTYRMSPDWKTMTELYGRGFLEDTPDPDPEWLDKYIHPEDQAFVLSVINGSIRDKKIFELEHRVLQADGSIGWTFSRAIPLFEGNGEIKEWFGAVSNITERKREEKLEQFARDLLNEIAGMSSSKEILRRVCQALGEYLRVGNVHMADMDEETDTARAYQGFTDQTVPPLEGEWPNVSSFWHPEMTAAFRSGMTVVVRNAQHHPWTIAEKYAPTGVAAFVTVPFIEEGVWRHFISVISAEPRDWREDEIRVAERVTRGVFPHLQRARAGEELRESEARYRGLFESIQEPVSVQRYVLDDHGEIADWVFVDANPAAFRDNGLTREEYFGKSFIELFGAETIRPYLSAAREMRRRNAPVTMEREFAPFDRHYQCIFAPFTGDLFIVSSMNITDIKRTEEALRESESLYRTLFDNTEDGFVLIEPIIDSDGRSDDHRVLSVNKTWERQTGLKAADLVGKRVKEVFPDVRSVESAYFAEVAKTGAAKRFEEYGHNTGRWYDQLAFPYKKGQVCVLVRDITERKRAEEALRESEKKAHALVSELEKADKNKNRFISILSHELRNPLAVISAGVQLLDITRDENQINKAKEIMKRQTSHLCKLVDDLLELTRISQNKIKLKKETINLNEIIKGTVEDIRQEYEKNGKKLVIKIQAKPILLSADSVRITQIIGNILHNALKFTQENGVVWLTLKTEKNNAVIRIKDNGIGISPDILPQLFNPFIQADHSLARSNSGLGLGLSIVKGIVDLHGGNVNVQSEGLGKGATFTICLPIKSEGEKKTEEKIPCNKDKKNLKLLIIDDNRDFADLLSTMLSATGYENTVAYDGEKGLESAKQIKPDVVFCDIGLPGMNGYEVAERIRNDKELKDAHLIALTGYAGESDVERVIKAGFDKHLAKPIYMDTLEKVLLELN